MRPGSSSGAAAPGRVPWTRPGRRTAARWRQHPASAAARLADRARCEEGRYRWTVRQRRAEPPFRWPASGCGPGSWPITSGTAAPLRGTCSSLRGRADNASAPRSPAELNKPPGPVDYVIPARTSKRGESAASPTGQTSPDPALERPSIQRRRGGFLFMLIRQLISCRINMIMVWNVVH